MALDRNRTYVQGVKKLKTAEKPSGSELPPTQLRRLENAYKQRVKLFLETDGFKGADKRLKGLISDETVRFIKKTYC